MKRLGPNPTSFLILFVVLFVGVSNASAQKGWVHPFDYPQPESAPDELHAVIEIPTGSAIKYEIDEETGHLFVDRFQSMPVAYPANYGSICRSLAGDNDPLDILVYTRAPIAPGAIIRARPIGVLKTKDGGEQDDKILAVPVSKLDPTYDAIQDLDDLPEIERQRVEAFFRVYKELPEGRKTVELQGFGDRGEALTIIRDALRAYQTQSQPRAQAASTTP